MITTLRTGALTLDNAVEYKFADNLLTIRITTNGAHKIYGKTNIALTEAEAITIKKKDGSQVADYFNKTFAFSRVSATELEFSEEIESGIAASAVFDDLPTADADPIVATVANSSFDLAAGTYNFLLLDSADSVFSGATIGIKLLNVGQTGEDGIEAEFDEEGEADLLSINNQDLHFNYGARVSLLNNNAGVTNIPLIINN